MKNSIVASLILSTGITASAVAVFIPEREALAEESGTFSGSWIASGKRQSMDFLSGRVVSTFHIEGHLNLEDDVGEVRDFWSECIGLWDAETGGEARCVWRGLEGDKVFSVLRGELLKQDITVKGEFVGGTGRAEGIEGGFTLTSSRIYYDGDERVLTLHSKDLSGNYRIP